MLLGAGANLCHAQALPAGVQDVIKLAQAGVSEDVILAQIKNSPATYNLTADQIIELKIDGVSQPVIKALLNGGGSPIPANSPAPAAPPASIPLTATAPPPAPAPVVAVPASAPPTAASFDNFQNQLAPYGIWIQDPVLSLCWQPAVAVTDPSWRPYFNQ